MYIYGTYIPPLWGSKLEFLFLSSIEYYHPSTSHILLQSIPYHSKPLHLCHTTFYCSTTSSAILQSLLLPSSFTTIIPALTKISLMTGWQLFNPFFCFLGKTK